MVNFIDLFTAITRFDGPMISSLMMERSKTPESVIDAPGFTRSMTQFIQKVKEKTLAFKSFTVTEILAFVFDQVRTHHVKIDGDYVNVGVGLMLIEGIGRNLEPEMDLMQAALPFLQEALLRRWDGDVSASEIAFKEWMSHRWALFWAKRIE